MGALVLDETLSKGKLARADGRRKSAAGRLNRRQKRKFFSISTLAHDKNPTWAKNVRRNEGNYEYCGDYRCFQRNGTEFAMQLDRGLHSVDEFWLIARRGSRLKEIASGMQHTVRFCRLI